jgi:hypothetical protein
LRFFTSKVEVFDSEVEVFDSEVEVFDSEVEVFDLRECLKSVRSPLAPLKKGGTGFKVPSSKGGNWIQSPPF